MLSSHVSGERRDLCTGKSLGPEGIKRPPSKFLGLFTCFPSHLRGLYLRRLAGRLVFWRLELRFRSEFGRRGADDRSGENDWTGACCSSRTGAGVASIFVGAAAGGGVTFGASGRLVSGAYMCGWVAGRA